MTVIARITSDAKLKLKGNLILSPSENIFRLNNEGNLTVKEVYTVWQGFDDSDNVDDTYQLDDTHSIDDSLGLEDFIGYLFGLTVEDIPIDKFKITSDKKLLVSEVLENQTL